MVRIGIALSFVCFATVSALCEPLTLISSHTLMLPYGIEGGAVSPDGRWFAAQGNGPAGLVVVHIATNTVARRFRSPSMYIRGFGWGMPKTGAAPRWDAGSRFVWSADVETTRSGFPVGPLIPATAVLEEPLSLSGPPRRDEPATDPMSRLRGVDHAAGLLDGLLWADDRGRAFVLFGSKASLWRLPEHSATPTFAMVDVTSERIIASLSFTDAMAPLAATGDRLDRFSVEFGTASTLLDGRMQLFAVMSARLNGDEANWRRTWLVWTERESPRLLPQPYPMQSVRFALTPDGSTVLATLPLGAGVTCRRVGGCQVMGPPVEGPLVVAHDLLTGAAIWTLRATSEAQANRRAPMVSPDGRLALVELATFNQVGVVDATSGRLLQTLTSNIDVTFGFFQQGRCAFIYAPDHIQIYEVDAQASASPSRCRPSASLK
jgi:hypothetical protein